MPLKLQWVLYVIFFSLYMIMNRVDSQIIELHKVQIEYEYKGEEKTTILRISEVSNLLPSIDCSVRGCLPRGSWRQFSGGEGRAEGDWRVESGGG